MNPSRLKIEIILLETLDERWAVWFEGLSLTACEDGSTRLSGELPDRAALHGCLERIRDLNLRFILVKVEEK